jgi:EAL domain-containing protein (putative c-di-GMP-specific phosphodiesterase class I)
VSARGTGLGTARPVRPDEAPVSWRRSIERVLTDPAGHLDLAFQPVVDLQRGVVVGYEALARLAGPPSAPPDRWFAAAADEGLAARLEAAVLERALPTRAALPPDCFLSVNLNPNLVLDRTVQGVLDDAGELPGVVLELTEHDRIDDYGGLRRALTRLRASGVNIAMDDAGAGYAGLSSLLALRPDLVKLDRSLIAGIDVDPVKQELVELLATMVGRMDAWVLAEGVERLEELESLIRLGVPLAQGFLLGRPAPDLRGLDDPTAGRIRELAGTWGEGAARRGRPPRDPRRHRRGPGLLRRRRRPRGRPRAGPLGTARGAAPPGRRPRRLGARPRGAAGAGGGAGGGGGPAGHGAAPRLALRPGPLHRRPGPVPGRGPRRAAARSARPLT